MSLIEVCNLCASRDFLVVKNKLRDDERLYKVFKCATCGHYQLMPKPRAKDDSEFYNENLQDKNRNKRIDYHELKKNNLFDTLRHAELVEGLIKNRRSRILDIGAGYGFFVNELYERGYKKVVGLEISDERRGIAIEHTRAKIMKIDIIRPHKEIGRFDVITLFHVLEHLSNPIAFIKKVKNFMKPDGLLVCEVPNVRELLLDSCPEYNNFYWIRAHLNYFSKDSFFFVLNQAGLRSIQINFVQRYGLVNLCNWLVNGTAQIEKPVFDIPRPYVWVQDYYRKCLQEAGRSDTLIALARINKSSQFESLI